MINTDEMDRKNVESTLNSLTERKAGGRLVNLNDAEYGWMEKNIRRLLERDRQVGSELMDLRQQVAELSDFFETPLRDDDEWTSKQEIAGMTAEAALETFTKMGHQKEHVSRGTMKETFIAAGMEVSPFAIDDEVLQPNHYRRGGVETIDIIKLLLSDEEFQGFLKGNIIKYRDRAGAKNGQTEAKDLSKAANYYNMTQGK